MSRIAVSQTFKLTTYPSKTVTDGRLLELTGDRFADFFKNAKGYRSKDCMPLLQGVTRPRNSRKTGAAVEQVFVIVVEHDGGTVSIDEAQRRLQTEGIQVILYTTPSHAEAAPRWRGVLLLRHPKQASEYADLVSAANAALGGALARESWEVSRCYFYGRVKGSEYKVLTSEGMPLDDWAVLGETLTFEAAQAAADGVAKASTPPKDRSPHPVSDDRALERAIALDRVDEKTLHDLRFALEVMPSNDRHEWVRLGHALASLIEVGFGDQARELWLEWSRKSAAFQDGDEDLWDTFKPTDITYKSVFAAAYEIDKGWQARATLAWATRANALDPDVPAALHLCTDQANANRIIKNFGGGLMVVAGSWYTYDGRCWRLDETRVYRSAARLSAIIGAEAEEWDRKPAKDGEEREDFAAIARALRVWAKKSEMKAQVEQAVGLIKKWVRIEASQLDADPEVLNCLNGTLDLKTGTLRPHEPTDYITKLCRLNYKPGARSALWEETVEKACLEFGQQQKPLTRFVQRWFGYCATGLVSEQKFAIHFGAGSNAKSTIIDTIATVLGDYAGTAPPDLVISARGDRHPTEVADLLGRRMVTASESGQAGELREEFVKQVTGGDKLKGRFMRQDFFEFDPTHKLQLITNHRPTIRGTDYGIWRRVLLIPYGAKFATEEEVAAGQGHYIKDTEFSVKDALGPRGPVEHREAVLAWIIEGVKDWYANGLKPPSVVLVASKEYQADQDRVGQFVDDRCVLGAEFTVMLGGDWGGLYQAYREWCKENGHFPLGAPKLMTELERVVPGFRKGEQKRVGGRIERKKTRVLHGFRLWDAAYD